MTNTNNAELFHDGDIQSGIAAALQEDKCVVCFIQDETEESEQWLAWIQDHHIPSQLQKNAITLRIKAGSAEANAFNAFSQIPRTPMVSIIYNGTVTEQLVLGTTKNEFTLRLLRAISPSQRSKSPSSTSAPQPAPSSPLPPVSSQNTAASQTTQETAHTTLEQPNSNPASKKSKGKGRADDAKRYEEPTQESKATPGKSHSDAQKYARQNVERKKEMIAEKERVRALVENDKVERKLREERRRAERSSTAASSELPTAQPSNVSSPSNVCAVRVRLLDGTTMTSSFQAREKLSNTVRPWVVKDRKDGNLPFKFKQILTPLPSKTIQPEDEDKTLLELGLTPNANLILVPLKKVASAYPNGSLGSAQAFFAKVYTLLASIVLTMVNFISSMFSVAPASRAQQQQQPAQTAPSGSESSDNNAETTQSEPSSASAGSKIRVRTLADQRRRDQTDDQQLYNGNQLNFEPKNDDDDDDDNDE